MRTTVGRDVSLGGVLVYVILALAGCIIPQKLHVIPSSSYYHAECVCSSCATALTPQGTCPQLGAEYSSNSVGCGLAAADGEKEFESNAREECKTNNVMGKFDCHLIEVDPTDTSRSKFVEIEAEKSCDKSSSGLTSTTPDDASIAVDIAQSWMSMTHASGSFKVSIGGEVVFRGGNCSGSDCPLRLTALRLRTSDSVAFVHSDGKQTQIASPAIVVPHPVDAVASKRISTPKPGYAFMFPKSSLEILASGTVDGRRILLKVSNEEDTASGMLLQDGSFLFDGAATVDSFKVTLHLVGRVRTWPPFLRIDSARLSKAKAGDVLELKLTYDALGQKAPLLRLIGEGLSIPLRPRNGIVRVGFPSRTTWLAVRACAGSVCVERKLEGLALDGGSHGAE